MTSHVPELKKSLTPLKTPSSVVVFGSCRRRERCSSLRGAACRRRTRRRTQVRERDEHDDRREDEDAQSLPCVRHGTPSPRAARSASRYSDPVTSTAPLGPAIERARASASPGSGSVSRSREPSAGKRCKFLGGQGAGVARGGRDEASRRAADSAASIPSTSLSREDRGDDDVPTVREPREEPAERLERVGAVPELERRLAPALEPARERDRVGRMRVDRPAEERLRRRNREREVAAARQHDRLAPRRPRERLPLRARRARPSRPPGRRRASRRRSPRASRRAASVWSRPTFVSTTTGARSTFVASSRPPSPASTTATSDPCLGELGERGRGQHLELRRREPGRRRPDARRIARSNPAGSVSSRSSHPATCGEVYAPTRSPPSRSSAAVIRVVVDLPFVPTTWIDG